MTELIHIHETDLSDLYKEANGFRPRHYKEWWTPEELKAEYDHLFAVCHDNDLIEKERESEALVEFETLVRKTIELGAADKKTAIRWLVDGEDLEMTKYDLKYFFWGHGLSYEIQNEWAEKFCG
jgi:hypothetical protein